ncbi:MULTISPECIES: phosphate acyltransferase PlsX [Rhodomicrobium]|uniref:phosphate acyltransferase PlsX n=1 Tax=Rhodomicrobium TaxID=1068 RepID=UPI000B4BDC31|nr:MULTISPECIES: phosphate acyltransferase PlsX [Rhodomicrobium]
MSARIRIALDAMGGDHGPSIAVPGAALSLIRHPDTEFLIFGDEAKIAPHLQQHPALAKNSRVIHTPVAVSMDAKPSQALRQGRGKSSMWMALEAVKRGEADAAVSAGNTGALMVMSVFCLQMLPNIDRPAIAGIWPTIDSECIVLDIGANVGADAKQLVDNAGMGAALARALFHVDRPSVGLLNIGVEEVKGLDEVKRASEALKKADLPIIYHGFVEGDDLGKGTVDVVVTEGFSGNIALKTAEGTAKQIAAYLRAALSRSLLARIGAFLAQGAFRALREKMDPRHANGGIFLGLQGIVIKSHGGADAIGFASAVDLGYDMAKSGLVHIISKDVERFQNALQQAPLLRNTDAIT